MLQEVASPVAPTTVLVYTQSSEPSATGNEAVQPSPTLWNRFINQLQNGRNTQSQRPEEQKHLTADQEQH